MVFSRAFSLLGTCPDVCVWVHGVRLDVCVGAYACALVCAWCVAE